MAVRILKGRKRCGNLAEFYNFHDMDAVGFSAFKDLFEAAMLKTFGHPLQNVLSEGESKLFSNKVLDATGLVIGWKTLKNYSIYLHAGGNGKSENPSISSLDTLSRYVTNASYTDEAERKKNAGHYPYWYDYKNRFVTTDTSTVKPVSRKKIGWIALAIAIISLAAYFILNSDTDSFSTDFTKQPIPGKNGWQLQHENRNYWNKNQMYPGYLTLFTLRGDSWPDTVPIQPAIPNLLFRRLSNNEHFTTTIFLEDFIPAARWQQAGLILMEDTMPGAKNIRISLAFNDEFGGYKQSPEVIVQVITSLGSPGDKTEEIAHQVIYKQDSLLSNPLLIKNFHHSALRIEKQNNRFRILYAGGAVSNSAFHEIVSRELECSPKYVGLFALKGYVDDTTVVPVKIKGLELRLFCFKIKGLYKLLQF